MSESDSPDTVDIPLIAIEVPSNMECKYISRVEDNESQTDYENMARFSRDVLIRDTCDPLSTDETRKILLGLRDDSKGLVSVDILFRYNDNVNGEIKSSSVWLQMSGAGTNGDHKTELEIERVDTRSKEIRRLPGSKRKAKIKHSRKPVEYDLPDETGFDHAGKNLSEIDDIDIEEYPDEKAINKKNYCPQRKKTCCS